MEWLTSFAGIATIVVAMFIAVCAFFASRYEKVGPNEVLIVSGRRSTYRDPVSMEMVTRNFRIYHGGGTFVWPVRERVDRMSVELMTLEIRTPEFFTKFGVPIVVDAIAQIKVRSDDPVATATAAEMFLSKGRDEMNEIAHQMMQGHLRAVISTLPFEECHANPEAFAQTVQRLTGEDLANMGIQVVSFTIRGIQDPGGYLTALGRPQMAQVRRDADLGEANALRDATIGKAKAERESAVESAKASEESWLAQISAELAIANAERDKNVRLHEYNREVAQSQATSDVAYALQKAKVQQAVVEEEVGVTKVERSAQVLVEELEIQRRQKELVHAIEKPAEAERYRIEALAKAEQQRLTLLAEAEANASRIRGIAEADVIRAKGDAEAEAIRQKGLAEGDGLRAKYLAEADGMKQKAQAWQEYTAAAVLEKLIEKLPEMASAVAAPLQQIDRIVMISNDGGDSTGVERVTRSVTNVLAQIPGVVEMVSGLNLSEMIAGLPGLKRSSAPAGAPEAGTSTEPEAAVAEPPEK